MKTNRKCAYCSSPDQLTREHIFPSSIIKCYENDMLSLNDKTKRTFKSDLVVKDVCKTCNNGVLSQLDGKLLDVYKEHMHQDIMPGEAAELEYKYNDLFRVLLKISFNSARASSDGIRATKALKTYVPFIMGQAKLPKDSMLRLQILTSSKKLNTATNQTEGTLDVRLLRSCKIQYSGAFKSSFIVRLIAFNNYWFYMILPTKKVTEVKKSVFLEDFKNIGIQPGIELTKDTENIKIPVEKTTYLHPALLSSMVRDHA